MLMILMLRVTLMMMRRGLALTLAQPMPKLTAPTRVCCPDSSTVNGPPLSPWTGCKL